jgi:hypothetical protein
MNLAERTTRVMALFDLGLGTAALAAPERTLRALGHAEPSADAAALMRRCGPIWLTFAAAHAVAARSGRSRDWWALAWLRATELATDAVWARSSGFAERPGARAMLRLAGGGNLALSVLFARQSRITAA